MRGACQSVLWYLLIPGVLAGLVMGLRRNPRAAVLILLWGPFAWAGR